MIRWRSRNAKLVTKRMLSFETSSRSEDIQGNGDQDTVLSFGKHQGKPIKQVDDGYLWSMQANHSSPWWRRLASQILEQRKHQQEARNIRNAILAELKACTSTRNLARGKEIHAEARERGNHSIYIDTGLINMYARCGSMVDAQQVFDSINQPDVVSWTALILGYAENGEAITALDLFTRMKSQGCAPDSFTFVAALKACTSLSLKEDGSGRTECLERGRRIHSEIGCHLNIYVQSTLIDMYSKSGSMVDARQVFEAAKHRDVVSWNALILGYAENGEGITALDLFARMKGQGCAPTSVSYVAAIKACTSLALKQGGTQKAECLKRGKQLHLEIGCRSTLFVQSTLIDMYSKCGSMVDAHRVFNGIKHPDVVSWNALTMGYAENGEGATALDLYEKMKSVGCAPTAVTYVAALKACTSFALRGECLERGKRMHLEIGCHSDSYVRNTLIDMYAKCGSMVDAHQAFDSIKQPDVVSWAALIMGYAENGDGATALDLFAKMKSEGFALTSVIYVAALKACALLGALESGIKIHAEMDAGTKLDVVLVTCLVDFYAKCGSMVEAQNVFDLHHRTRDLITLNALLAGYGRLGDSEAVFRLFEGIQDAGFQPDGVTFLCILNCCSHAGLVAKANEFFDAMCTTHGITPTIEHYSCMVDTLGRSNKLDDAVTLLQSMPCRPDTVAWLTILGACRKWKNVEIGKLAFDSLVSLDDTNSAAYVLMGHIYGSKGMWDEQEMVLGLRRKFKAWKEPGQSWWTNEMGEVHTFRAGDCKHCQIDEIQEKLKAMVVLMRKHGYIADLFSINDNITDSEKEDALCGHSERLAIACALINTQAGKTIRIVKNLRVCDDCHTATALISKLELRTIICRDASRFHVFNDGKCSCGDFW